MPWNSQCWFFIQWVTWYVKYHTSTSLASKIVRKVCGMSSLKPPMNAAICCWTRSLKRHLITRLKYQKSGVYKSMTSLHIGSCWKRKYDVSPLARLMYRTQKVGDRWTLTPCIQLCCCQSLQCPCHLASALSLWSGSEAIQDSSVNLRNWSSFPPWFGAWCLLTKRRHSCWKHSQYKDLLTSPNISSSTEK